VGSGKPVILALFTAAALCGQNVALADNGGVAQRNAAVPNANLGLAVPAAVVTKVGLPAGALNAPGKIHSASLAGTEPPGKIKETNPVASSTKSAEAAEKLAASAGDSSRAASDSEARLSQLPTCR
jgi:hypothetical protein